MLICETLALSSAGIAKCSQGSLDQFGPHIDLRHGTGEELTCRRCICEQWLLRRSAPLRRSTCSYYYAPQRASVQDPLHRSLQPGREGWCRERSPPISGEEYFISDVAENFWFMVVKTATSTLIKSQFYDCFKVLPRQGTPQLPA